MLEIEGPGKGESDGTEAVHGGTIIGKLREAEVALSRGQSVGEACRTLGITDQTYYQWRKVYGGLRLDQAKRLKDLERENSRLKRVVADQALDLVILKEASSGNS